jgi:CheY-like chemotaxis protein
MSTYKVNLVASGEEAVEYLRCNKADILVLDMIMAPGIDGLETYQRVLEINPKELFKNNLDIIAFCLPSLWHDNDRANAYSI